MCTQSELRIVSVPTQTKLQFSCSPCCQTQLWGTKTSMRQECLLSYPEPMDRFPPPACSDLPPLRFCSFLPASGWVCSTHFCGIQEAEEKLPAAAPDCQPQLGVLVVLSPSLPQTLSRFFFPSFLDKSVFPVLCLGKPLRAEDGLIRDVSLSHVDTIS